MDWVIDWISFQAHHILCETHETDAIYRFSDLSYGTDKIYQMCGIDQ